MPHPEDTVYDSEFALVIASALSVIASIVVIVTYSRYKLLRRHPSSLIVWRSVVDFIFCMELIVTNLPWVGSAGFEEAINDCAVFSFVTQFCCLAAEGYFLMLSVDLVLAVTNPFTNYKTNTRWYHGLVVAFSFLSAVLLISLRPNGHRLYGRTNDLAVCWTRSNATGHRAELNLYTWLLFTGPLLLIYVFSTGAVIFASRRLREGLPETYKTRMGVFRNSARYVFGYIVYWTILGSLYAAVYFNEGRESSFVRYALAVVTGCRGLVTLAVWLWTQNMQEAYARHKDGSDDTAHFNLRPELNTALREEILFYTTMGIQRALKYSSTRSTLDDPRMQCNVIRLPRDREQVQLSMVSGVMGRRNSKMLVNRASTRRTHLLRSVASGSVNGDHSSSASSTAKQVTLPRDASDTSKSSFRSHTSKGSDTGSRSLRIGLADDAYHRLGSGDYGRQRSFSKAASGLFVAAHFAFKDFKPQLFREIREAYNIDDDAYYESFYGTDKERFTGGGSGAFLYFSQDRRFIVKTLSQPEAKVLLEILPAYVNYMKRNPHTLIAKFLGCHSIRMYRRTMFFVVMENVLNSELTIHERYDLKGSWVARQHSPVAYGSRTICRHCNEHFKVGITKDMCPSRPNRKHEPNVVLKDNDLNLKLRLDQTSAEMLANQIADDVAFLQSQKIMDYSLLLGVHRAKYRLVERQSSRVALSRTMSGRSSTRFVAQRLGDGSSTPVLPSNNLVPVDSGDTAMAEVDEVITGRARRSSAAAKRRRQQVGVSATDSPNDVLGNMRARRRSFLRREVSSGGLSMGQVLAHAHGTDLAASIAAASPRIRPPSERSFGFGDDSAQGDGAEVIATGTRVHHTAAAPRSPGGRSSATSVAAAQAGLVVTVDSLRTGPPSSPVVHAAAIRPRGGGNDGGEEDARLSEALLAINPTVQHLRLTRSQSAHSLSALDDVAVEDAEGVAQEIGDGDADAGADDARSAPGGTPQPGRLSDQRKSSGNPRRPSALPPLPRGSSGLADAGSGFGGGGGGGVGGFGAGAGAGARSFQLNREASELGVQSFFRQHSGGLKAVLVEGPGIYYMGIIDILQKWTFWKRLEHWCKVYILCRNRHGISAIHHDEYAERFITRVAHEIIDHYDDLVASRDA